MPLVRRWNHLPSPLQDVIPRPVRGGTVFIPGRSHVGLSIYWAWIEPTTHMPVLSPSGDVIMTTDSGKEFNLEWPEPFEDEDGKGIRQIYMDDPPRNSRKLHFSIPVNGETVGFSIDNPAYAK